MAFTSHVYLTASDSQAVSVYDRILIEATFPKRILRIFLVCNLQWQNFVERGQVAGLNTQLIGNSTLNLGSC